MLESVRLRFCSGVELMGCALLQENIFKPLEMHDLGDDADRNPVFDRRFCGDRRKRVGVGDRQRERRRFVGQKCPYCGRNRLDRERFAISGFSLLDFINPDFGYLLPMTGGSDEITFKLRHQDSRLCTKARRNSA
jgi:hypothetical protein